MAIIHAAYILHERECPAHRPDLTCCAATPFSVRARFVAPEGGDVREGIRRARVAARDQARRVADAIVRSDA